MPDLIESLRRQACESLRKAVDSGILEHALAVVPRDPVHTVAVVPQQTVAAAQEEKKFNLTASVGTWLMPLPYKKAASPAAAAQVPAAQIKKKFNLKPSVGTWLLPQPICEAKPAKALVEAPAQAAAAAPFSAVPAAMKTGRPFVVSSGAFGMHRQLGLQPRMLFI